MRVLALVTAKSYSTRVEGKNLKNLMGKPLYKWTIDFLLRNKRWFDTVAFSTDDPSKFVIPQNVNIITRPKQLCEDSIPHVMSVKHGLLQIESKFGLEFDYVLLFQPTNPFRSEEELINMITLLEKHKPSLAKTYYVDDNIQPGYVVGASFDPEINEKGVVIRSGSMYAYSRRYLMGAYMTDAPDTVYVTVPKRRGYNINTEEDFTIVEALMKANKCELKR